MPSKFVPSRSKRSNVFKNEPLESRQMLAGTGGFGDGIDDPHCVEVHDHAEDAYQVGSRWGSTASGSTGGTGSGITLTYSIVPDGTTLTSGAGEPNATSNFITRMNAIYAGGSATWLPIVAQAFASWSNVTGITYIYQPTDDGVPMNKFPPSSALFDPTDELVSSPFDPEIFCEAEDRRFMRSSSRRSLEAPQERPG